MPWQPCRRHWACLYAKKILCRGGSCQEHRGIIFPVAHPSGMVAHFHRTGGSISSRLLTIELSPEEATVVDTDVLIKFICSNCDFIPEELCERMLEAEYEYFVLIGLVDDSDF